MGLPSCMPVSYTHLDVYKRQILEDVERLYAKCRNLVIVTGEVASDGISYDESTESYIRLLQRVNCSLCQQAEEAYEVVYTIPVCQLCIRDSSYDKGRIKACYI